jgi:hypothetical protein
MFKKKPIEWHIKPENANRLLDEKLSASADVANKRAEKYMEKTGARIIDEDGRINMDEFTGPEVESDKARITKLDESFLPDLSLDSVQEFYRDKYKDQNLSVEDIKKKLLKDQENRHGFLAEKAITILLAKYLPEKYIVARTSKHDDLINRFDTIIIDLESGEVVCGFDEVYYDENRPVDKYINDRKDKQERVDIKIEKMKKINRDGVTAKYCYYKEDGKLKPGQAVNLPVFYLGLSKVELFELLEELKKGNTASEKCRSIFMKLAGSLLEQRDQMEKIITENPRAMNEAVKKNFRNLKNFFNMLNEAKNV